MFDLLHAVDWVVDDPRAGAARVVELLRLPPVEPAWDFVVPSHRYEAVFTKAAPALVDAPTRLELIHSVDVSPDADLCSLPPMQVAIAAQGDRRQRTHATVLCVADFDQYTEWLRRAGTAVWIEPGCAHLPNRRGWLSWTSGTDRQTPATDAGLFLEYIPTSVLGRAVATSVDVPSAGHGPRVTRRTHLVDDLDAVVRTLERHAGLEPGEAIHVDGALAATVARYTFRHPASAVLELVEPIGDGPAADYAGAWGAGPWFTGIAVDDPVGIVDGARAAGCPTARVGDASLVEIDPGMLFEVVAVGA